MTDRECVQFLQWALPRLRLRWPGFRKVRKQVCKRIARRQAELGLDIAEAYKTYLRHHEDEWERLDGFCRISISRFYRDRDVFDTLRRVVLPELQRRAPAAIRSWCAGCASGEEPYTLSLIRLEQPALSLAITGTDVDPVLLERAHAGCYPPSSLKTLPESWRSCGFDRRADHWCVKSRFRHDVRFLCQDIRKILPAGEFELILCRNTVFTYFEEGLQRIVLKALVEKLAPEGALVLGRKERLPAAAPELDGWFERIGVYRRGAGP